MAVLLISCLIVLYVFIYHLQNHQMQEISYTQFHLELQHDKIAQTALMHTQGDAEKWMKITRRNGTTAYVVLPPGGLDLEKLLLNNVVVFQKRQSALIKFLGSAVFRVIAFFVFIWGLNLLQSNLVRESLLDTLPFSESMDIAPAKIPETKFADIVGCGEAKAEIQELVDFLKNPGPYHSLGARMPRGVILHGPPGTGKTLLAKALAGEAKVPFLYFSASEFEEVYVGLGASRLRAAFKKARELSPCIMFIDELDSIGGRRSDLGGYSTAQQTLNQLLTELDGFNERSGVLVIGATNRIDTLDPALLRPGRFDQDIATTLPTLKGREAILQLYLQRLDAVDSTVDPKHLARQTPEYSGASLENLINQSAILAVRNKRSIVTAKDIEDALERLEVGVKADLDETEEPEHLIRTAYHEAGHAIVTLALERPGEYSSLKFSRISIYRRGDTLGHVTWHAANEHGLSKQSFLERLALSYGGRCAETLIYGDLECSPGASSDLKMAYCTALRMVREFGFHPDESAPRHYPKSKVLSEELKETIEQDVTKFLQQANQWALEILELNKDAFKALADEVLKHRSLTAEEVKDFFAKKGIKLRRPPMPSV